MIGRRSNAAFRAAIIALAAQLVAGCGDQPRPPSIASNSDARESRFSVCPLTEGRSWVFTDYNFLDATFSHDFGDGIRRNALAVAATPSFNKLVNDNIDDIDIKFGAHINGFTGDTLPAALPSEAMITMELVADPNRDDDAGGEVFCADPEQFNVRCEPTSRSSRVLIHDNTIDAYADPISIVARNFGAGAIGLRYADMRFTSGRNWDEMNLLMYAVWPVCAMASVNGPSNSSSFLDFVTSQKTQAIPLGPQPDFLLDTDGIDGNPLGSAASLPVFYNENGRVTSCEVDGEIIDGPDCPCSSRIHAGYTSALSIQGEAAIVRQLCDEQ